MTKARQYRVLNPLPPMTRPKPMPPVVRRCGSGDYEVLRGGVLLQGGFDSYDEAAEWIKDNCDV